MNDLFHTLPWVRLGSASSHDRSQTTGTPSPPSKPSPKQAYAVQPLTRLFRGASDLLTWRHHERASTSAVCKGSKDGQTAEQQRQIMVLRMKNATDNAQWTTAARELDLLEGNDFWKLDNAAPKGEYNPDLISSRLRELDEARTNCDITAMMHLVRTALTRDLGGMGNIELYRHSYDGTKHLIEQYVESAVKTIDDLVEKSSIPGALPEGIDHKDVLQTVVLARQSFGRTALMLSGGGTWGMMHIGVLKAMFHADLLPRIISGASAGSIVCSVLCTRTNDEIPEVLDRFPYGDLAVFEEQGNEESVADHLKRLLTEGTWSDIKHLTRVMRSLLGDVTFQEAYNRTRRICNISVSTASVYELPRLLNYITAPNVIIWSAVLASCSVPLLFSAAPLLAKNPHTGEHVPWNPTEQMWMDGSVDNDLPMTRLAEMFNVNHFIVSQVNPHITPFMSKEDSLDPAHVGRRAQMGSSLHDPNSWLYTLTTLAKDEALHRLQFMAELGIFPNLATKLRSVLIQKYSGDINIIPEFTIQDVPRILKNPTVDFMLRSCLAGEKATWPKLSRIKNQCAIELALDRALNALRARVAFSASQINLRRLITGSKDLGIGLGAAADADSRELQIQSGRSPPRAVSLDKDRSRHHHRRGSGSSIQLLARHRHMMMNLENVLTDEDTEQEERLELRSRRTGATPSQTNRTHAGKPRLVRAAKSQLNVPLALQGPSSSPLPGSGNATGETGSEFDFSKPITPPKSSVDSCTLDGASDAVFGSTALPEPPALTLPTPSPRLDVLSPTTGAETSDMHTSDGDVDYSHTDESLSDPEPYEQELSFEEVSKPT